MSNPNIKNYGFGSRPREVDDALRAKSHEGPRRRVWTKEKCIEELEDCLNILKKILKDDEKIDKDNSKKLKQETIRDTVTLMNRMLEYMKYLYPPVQQNVNINVDVTANEVIERLKDWKKKQKEEQVVNIVVEEKNE
jgi:hypothetical protein